MKTNRELIVLGGGRRGLELARRCGAVHVDVYAEVDPREVEGGIQIHVQDRELALLFIRRRRVLAFPEFADLLDRAEPEEAALVGASGDLCRRYRCVEEPC